MSSTVMVDLVATNAAQVVTLGVLEKALDEGAGVRRCRRFARAEALVNVFEGFLFVAGRVLLEAAHDGAVVGGGVDDRDLGDASGFDAADDRAGERLEGAGKNHALFGVHEVFNEDELGDALHFEGVGNGQFLNLVEEVQDVVVGREAERAQERRNKELAAAAAAVEVDVEKVVLVELAFEPRATVRNDAERVEQLAAGVGDHFKGDARRAVQLGNDDAFGSVDDERTAFRHHGHFAHVDFLVLDRFLFLEAQLHVERNGVGHAFADAFHLGHLRTVEVVGHILQLGVAIVAFDGEHFAEHGLQTDGVPLRGSLVLLQKLLEGVDLNLDQVRGGDDFLELTEIDAIRHGLNKLVVVLGMT
jgi:hypothetical protein